MIAGATAWLDERLGRISMYRLLTLGLGSIAVIAVLLGATGTLAFAPLDMLLSLAVAVASSAVSGFLIARAFRVEPHAESTLITGLILFFLFWPTSEPRYLGALALAAVLANLSKYVIAWRGRHLLNPAAAGALVIGLSGLDVATWWVADRALLIPVLVLAVLIVARTRTVALVGGFTVVALLAIAIRLSAEGQALGPALWTVVTSYPVLFLGAVMLTEPLTLPPRRWQRLVEAALVGVLLAIPFTIGPVASSPELALVVGNLFAFAWGQRGAIRLTLIESRRIGPRTRELRLRADRPLRFRPGQYLELTVPHDHPDARGTRRVFSISSAPGEGELTVALTIPERPSSFKRALADLPVGAPLRATGVAGDFLLPDDRRPVLLIAGGIGVTPFASQIAAGITGTPATAKDSGEGETTRDAVLLHAVADHGDLAYADVFRAGGVRVLVASPTPQATLPPGYLHLGIDRLTVEALIESVPDLDLRIAYVSGPPAMVDHTRALLRAAGVRRVRTDAFSGY
ncbi:oxidoreductase [Cellulomonas sp. NPDC089187]|uniref:FAD-dependent oxidoreductase n=1 Tax=Cellulomonas sp. NPDC089187 TaxID=3154970 RepID=UPI003446D598